MLTVNLLGLHFPWQRLTKNSAHLQANRLLILCLVESLHGSAAKLYITRLECTSQVHKKRGMFRSLVLFFVHDIYHFKL